MHLLMFLNAHSFFVIRFHPSWLALPIKTILFSVGTLILWKVYSSIAFLRPPGLHPELIIVPSLSHAPICSSRMLSVPFFRFDGSIPFPLLLTGCLLALIGFTPPPLLLLPLITLRIFRFLSGFRIILVALLSRSASPPCSLAGINYGGSIHAILGSLHSLLLLRLSPKYTSLTCPLPHIGGINLRRCFWVCFMDIKQTLKVGC